ncbi:MAG: DUF2339 domain-containing protein [Clostridiales bacterium]|jgi:uncharacterized membrane protein|nr:DUF2339 domain-containing protein [Clostridiales bacterium]
MGTNEKLKDIINKQKETLVQLEAEYNLINNTDTVRENAELKTELEKLQAAYDKAQNNITALAGENATLKNALFEQIYSEKVKIVNAATQKLDIYFKSNMDNEINRLTNLENNVKARINLIVENLQKHRIDTKGEIKGKLNELSEIVNEKVIKAQEEAARVPMALSTDEQEELDALKSEQITDGQLREVTKKNNLERLVGLNLLNIIGVFLIIIGTITATRFTYARLPDTLKGIMMFTLGMAMLFAGELMNRKKPNTFSLGITAGGVGVLYVAVATSYFGLQILSMYPAISFCILITFVSFLLSMRYNSQIILAFALIGGYLPMYSIGTADAIIYAAMVYFVTLNLLALMVSFSKKWNITSFIGMVLNIAGTIYICYNFGYRPLAAEKAAAIIYVLFAFLIYTFIPVNGAYIAKRKFRQPDIVLLVVNTLASSMIMYGLFYTLKLNDFDGALAIIFAIVYLLLGRLIEKKFAGEDSTKALFYLTGLAFVVLIIPLQFGKAWLSLGWLAECTAIILYAALNNDRLLKRVGLAIGVLCLASFLCFDVLLEVQPELFVYKYLAMTIGSIVTLWALMYKKILSGQFERDYKYLVLVNIWLFAIYIIYNKLHGFLYGNYRGGLYSIVYLTTSLCIVVTFLIAYTLPRIKVLADAGTKIISMALYFLGAAWLFELNNWDSPVGFSSSVPIGVMLIGTLILICIGLLSVFAVRDLMFLIVTGRKISIEWYPLIISVYFILILTQNLIRHYNLSFSSAIISILYVLAALVWIIFGFKKRYSFIRRFGLGLSILSVIKLFLIDLSSLTQGYKIFSYFALGATLVAISFVYQYFSKRLELKEGGATDG